MKKTYLAIEGETSFKIITEMEDFSISDLEINQFEVNKYESINVALKINSVKFESVISAKSLIAIEVDGPIRKTAWIRSISNKNINFKLEKDLELGECYMLDLKSISIHSHIPEHLPQIVLR